MKFDACSVIRRGLVASVAASALMGGTAFAQPLLPTWAGPYVGVNFGWYQTKLTANDLDGYFAAPGTTYSLTGNGVLGGVQGGFNWQFTNFVVGIESDFDFGSANHSAVFTVNCCTEPVLKSSIAELGTIRARFGYAFEPFPLLVYGTAGVAFGQVNNSVNQFITPQGVNNGVPPGNWSSNEWRGGYAVGGGLEYAIAPNWTVKAEALYVDLGTDTASRTYAFDKATFTKRISFRDTAVIARGGVNFKF